MVEVEQDRGIKEERLILFAIIMGTFISMVNSSTINIALPNFVRYFNSDLVTVQWVVVGYMLATGVMVPLVGFWGDKFSCRNVYLMGLVLFTLTSIGCAVSNHIYMLILFRVIQGVAGGMIMPVATTIIYQSVARDRQMMSAAIVSMVTTCGFAIGPTIGGALLTFSGWHSIFWINIPFSLIAIALVWRYVPQKIINEGQKLDVKGMMTVIIGTICLLMAFSNGGEWGWLSIKFILMLLAGLGCLIYFIWHEMSIRTPMLNFSVLRYRHFTCGLVMNATTNIALCLSPFLMAIYLQEVLLLSPLEAGSLLLIPTLVMSVVSPVAVKLANLSSNRMVILVGMILLLASTFELSRLSVSSTSLYVMMWLSLRYTGIGLLSPIVSNYAMSAVPRMLTGHASAMLNWVRQLITTLSLSIFTSILSVRALTYSQSGAVNALPATEGYALTQCLAINDVTFYSLIVLVLCFPLTFMFNKSNHSH